MSKDERGGEVKDRPEIIWHCKYCLSAEEFRSAAELQVHWKTCTLKIKGMRG